jgi:glutathione S-transferase
MQTLTLVIGSRNYSSWSLRAWLAATLTGLEFETVLIHFDEDKDRAQRRRYSPTGKVPALVHGGLVVWDSLAIGEYLAELAPDARLLPQDQAARAHCRSIVAEMHAGFVDLRQELPMNLRRRDPERPRSPATLADIQRIAYLWADTRRRFGSEGPYLFGAPTLADAAYAPVATRFETYGVELDGPAQDYRRTLLRWAPLVEWTEVALAEGHELAR